MNINYKQKYLKYKNKYLQIKKIYGGKNIIKGGTIIFDNNLDGFKSIRGDSNEEAELWNILYRNNVTMLNIPDEWDGWDGEKHFNILRNRGLKLKKEYYQEIIANLPNIMNNFIENEQHEDFEECLNLIKQIVNKRQAGVLRHQYDDSEDTKHDRILEKWRGVLETINPSVSCSESEKHKTPICRYFEKGYCREGENCRFQHGEMPVYEGDIPVIEEDNVPVQEVLLAEYTTYPPPPSPLPPSRGFAQKPASLPFGDPYSAPLGSYQIHQEPNIYPQQNIYKAPAKKCRNWMNEGYCRHGDGCRFSHQ